MGQNSVLSCSCNQALPSRPTPGLPKAYQASAGTPARLFRHCHTVHRQRLSSFQGARCCDGGGGDFGGSDHSSHDSDSGHSHSSYDSGHSHSSYDSGHSHGSHHSSSSHSDHDPRHNGSKHDSNHSSWLSNRFDGDDGHDKHSSKRSKHDHKDSKHGPKKKLNQDSDDAFLDDSALDILSMFDTERSNESIEYRPSSGTYYKPPSFKGNNPDFWAYKPAWCQPWSIISTGIAFVAGARWITGNSTIATVVAAVPILVWWYVFLVLVPGDFRKYANKKTF